MFSMAPCLLFLGFSWKGGQAHLSSMGMCLLFSLFPLEKKVKPHGLDGPVPVFSPYKGVSGSRGLDGPVFVFFLLRRWGKAIWSVLVYFFVLLGGWCRAHVGSMGLCLRFHSFSLERGATLTWSRWDWPVQGKPKGKQRKASTGPSRQRDVTPLREKRKTRNNQAQDHREHVALPFFS